MGVNDITGQIINCAINVHKNLGPGLLEGVYEACLKYELEKMDLQVEQQKILPVIYEGIKIDIGYRVDLIVEQCVIVELKAIEKFSPIHKAQLISYLKLSGLHVGLLINFNVVKLKDGIKRIVHEL